MATYSRYRAPFDPVLERLTVNSPAAGISASSVRIRIGFLTDTHIGPVFRATDAERALTLLAGKDLDVLLLGGDYVCESPRFVAEAAAVLGTYATLAKLGTFAVLGNHDYSNDAPRIAAQFERRGIQILRNEAAHLCTGGSPLWIVGIDDAVLGRPDLAASFSPVPPSDPSIALWHEPDWAEQTAAHSPFLQLSGHSHGGQIRLPGVGHLAAPSGGRRFVCGVAQVGDMQIYTSRGLGVYRPPIRFCCRPEITLVTVQL